MCHNKPHCMLYKQKLKRGGCNSVLRAPVVLRPKQIPNELKLVLIFLIFLRKCGDFRFTYLFVLSVSLWFFVDIFKELVHSCSI